jgi:hypothetical protein
MGFAIRNAEYVELIFPAAPKQQTFFPDLPNLRQKPVTGIEVYSANEQSKGQSGNDVVAANTLRKAYVVLYFDGGEYIQIPLQSIHRTNTVTPTASTDGQNITFFDIPQLAGQNIVWTKSYVFITDTGAINSDFGSKEIVFNVYYNR